MASPSVLSARERAVLTAICDAFHPPLAAGPEDDAALFATSAVEVGVPAAAAEAIGLLATGAAGRVATAASPPRQHCRITRAVAHDPRCERDDPRGAIPVAQQALDESDPATTQRLSGAEASLELLDVLGSSDGRQQPCVGGARLRHLSAAFTARGWARRHRDSRPDDVRRGRMRGRVGRGRRRGRGSVGGQGISRHRARGGAGSASARTSSNASSRERRISISTAGSRPRATSASRFSPAHASAGAPRSTGRRRCVRRTISATSGRIGRAARCSPTLDSRARWTRCGNGSLYRPMRVSSTTTTPRFSAAARHSATRGRPSRATRAGATQRNAGTACSGAAWEESNRRPSRICRTRRRKVTAPSSPSAARNAS
jgi:hypothetical protein